MRGFFQIMPQLLLLLLLLISNNPPQSSKPITALARVAPKLPTTKILILCRLRIVQFCFQHPFAPMLPAPICTTFQSYGFAA
jgi:hypothetical protein